MLAILLLTVAGVLIGLFYHWGMLAIASFFVVAARVLYHLHSGHIVLADLLMIAASLCALQGGYVFGGYVAFKKDI
ncbi:hypothetical protein LNAOJCKE_2540 [Methylorubrum aminovorans]|uniref:Uncharacterized protein n=1 Tax=Methylorubrum aminovorans TaxID=269069 RepID=A0ABQ4UHS4_9HYPH|nr:MULTISPECIES: hypothetical protein [Methylobacteriaceae]QIJ74823.1 hypothetical protein CLZ_09670 [Methylobacterium sp. CLZ]QIJ79728.1 hypothetical protein GU700_09670 [Methylobacterium sp. NI91]GJE65330.1 hypothetical protein LNAOJCKE_2540 [Methylorubrum aminovorans]GMA78715.1 hypothetical protein GCM10025880_51320 [Methylorubrum aminovorans]